VTGSSSTPGARKAHPALRVHACLSPVASETRVAAEPGVSWGVTRSNAMGWCCSVASDCGAAFPTAACVERLRYIKDWESRCLSRARSGDLLDSDVRFTLWVAWGGGEEGSVLTVDVSNWRFLCAHLPRLLSKGSLSPSLACLASSYFQWGVIHGPLFSECFLCGVVWGRCERGLCVQGSHYPLDGPW